MAGPSVTLFAWFFIAVVINIWFLLSVLRNQKLVHRKVFRTIFSMTLLLFGIGFLGIFVHELFFLFSALAFVSLILTGLMLRFYCVECGQAVGSLKRIPLCPKCRPNYFHT
jgi:hypothetical protein